MRVYHSRRKFHSTLLLLSCRPVIQPEHQDFKLQSQNKQESKSYYYLLKSFINSSFFLNITLLTIVSDSVYFCDQSYEIKTLKILSTTRWVLRIKNGKTWNIFIKEILFNDKAFRLASGEKSGKTWNIFINVYNFQTKIKQWCFLFLPTRYPPFKSAPFFILYLAYF